jgi:hypothetical protein
MQHSSGAGATDQQAAALEIVRREARRSGGPLRGVLTLVRVSYPPTQSEKPLLAALRLLHSPHAIMPHQCRSMEEWLAKYAPGRSQASQI